MNKFKRRTEQLLLLIKYVVCFIIVPFSKKYRDAWVISERGDDACDNGYTLYKYIIEYHPDIKVYYIISRKSKRRHLIKKENQILHKSMKNYIAFMTGKYLISTHIMGYTPDHGMFEKLDAKNLVYTKGKRVFLQHGVTQNYIPSLINKKIDLFITVSDLERNYIIEFFKYNEDVVKAIGFTRYDNLYNTSNEKYILVMPTWRKYLYYATENMFQNSDFYNNWNKFLYDERLLNALKTNNIKIKFVPHPEMKKFMHLFKNNKTISIIDTDKTSYQELIKNCSMLVTDYSSVYFDVAYQKKPILYFEFDKEKYNKDHYEEGYFIPERDGFGKVLYDYNNVIDETIKCIPNFKMSNKYQKRVENFFKYNDCNNCKRTYECIEEME